MEALTKQFASKSPGVWRLGARGGVLVWWTQAWRGSSTSKAEVKRQSCYLRPSQR